MVFYQAGVILADGHRGIIQGRQKISPDVADLCCIFVQAFHHIADVVTVQLLETAFYHFHGQVLLVDADGLPAAAADFRNQFHKTIQTFLAPGIIVEKLVISDHGFYLVSTSICTGCGFPGWSGCVGSVWCAWTGG